MEIHQVEYIGATLAPENICILLERSMVVRLRPNQAHHIAKQAVSEVYGDATFIERVMSGDDELLLKNGCRLVRWDDSITHPFAFCGYAQDHSDLHKDLVYYGVKPDEKVKIGGYNG